MSELHPAGGRESWGGREESVDRRTGAAGRPRETWDLALEVPGFLTHRAEMLGVSGKHPRGLASLGGT